MVDERIVLLGGIIVFFTGGVLAGNLVVDPGFNPFADRSVDTTTAPADDGASTEGPLELQRGNVTEFGSYTYYSFDSTGNGAISPDAGTIGPDFLLPENASPLGPGKYGQALYPGKAAQVRTMTVHGPATTSESLTLAFWFRPGDQAGSGNIITARGQSAKNQGLNIFSISGAYPGNKVNFNRGNSTHEAGVSTRKSNWETGKWYRLAARYDQGEWTLYVEGRRNGSLTRPVSISNPTTGGVHLGRKGFNGAIDELYIYGEALNTEQIRRLRDNSIVRID